MLTKWQVGKWDIEQNGKLTKWQNTLAYYGSAIITTTKVLYSIGT